MMGKMGLIGAVLLLGILLVIFSVIPYSGQSAEYQTGSTTMNVTIRGYVSITVSTCLTNGITFATQDPGVTNSNASCNTAGPGGGTSYNLTTGAETTVNVNFTHATNRTNLTDGTNTLGIGNVTTHSNSTANNGSNILDAGTSASLSTSWLEMETCGTLPKSSNCWATYFLDVPTGQPPGAYKIGYCWCGRQQATDESNCGTCT